MDETQLELISVPYSAFSKLEMARFALRLIDIVDSHNPEELKFKPIFDLMVAEKPRISKLKDKFGPHPLTAELNECREMRTLRISAIRVQLKIVIKENRGVQSKEFTLVCNEIKHFFETLKLSKHDEMFNQKIAQFFESIESNPELRTALTSMGFDKCVGDLKEIHDSIQHLIKRKLASIAGRPQEKTAELVKKVTKAINIMTKQIEIAPYVNVDLDYEPLFNELNQFFTEYKNMVNKRLAFNKKKAENATSTETVDTPPIKETIEETINTTTIKKSNKDVSFHTTEKDKLKEAVSIRSEMKKTVARSSETIQQPILENYLVIDT